MATADSDYPKLTNDCYGYVAGDVASAWAVVSSVVVMLLGGSRVCSGGEEPSSSSLDVVTKDVKVSVVGTCELSVCEERLDSFAGYSLVSPGAVVLDDLLISDDSTVWVDWVSSVVKVVGCDCAALELVDAVIGWWYY